MAFKYFLNFQTGKLDVYDPTTITIQEEDGSPTGTPGTLKFVNDSLTDNGDDTFSVNYDNRYVLSGGGGDTVWKLPVLTKDLVVPPESPDDGARYIVGAGVAGDWYSSGGTWSYRQKITIDHTKVPSTQTNFPVTIVIDEGSNPIFGHARSDAYDTIFTASDALTKLEHEIEDYDETVGNKHAEFHVKIPSLSSSVDTEIYLYYGNASVESDPSSTSTWDSNFKLVHHLNDLTTSTTKDSTSNGHNATKRAANEPSEASGKLGYCQSFDGTNDYEKITDVIITSPAALSISAWFNKPSDGPSYECALHHASGTTIGSSSYWLGVDINNNITATIGASVGGIGWAAGATTTKAVYGDWYHVMATWDGSVVKVYVNGVYNKQYNLGSYPNQTTPTRFGASSDGANYQFRGRIEEVRISDTARSADWITATYNNQNSPSTFYEIGDEESPAAGGDWEGHEKSIAIYNESVPEWTFDEPPIDGWVCWVTDRKKLYSYDGTSWDSAEVNVNHNQLADLQGGDTDEYWHITESEHTAATRDATNALNGLMPAGKMNSWDGKWAVGSIIDQELRIKMDKPAIRLHDTDNDSAYKLVHDAGDGTYPYLALYRGTVDVTTFTPDPATPLVHWDGDNLMNIYGDVGIRSQKELRFYEGANYIGFEAPALSADCIWVLPSADGNAGEVLQTDGSKNLSWLAGATTDEKVKIDSGATAGYIGAAYNDGVLRTDGTVITYTDGGDYVTIALDGTLKTNWDTAYSHSQDNSQAHSDYLVNNDDDTTSGTITMANLIVGDAGTIGSATDPDIMTLAADGTTTFSVFPVTPSAAPDADYEVANKKYVDDNTSSSGIPFGDGSDGTHDASDGAEYSTFTRDMFFESFTADADVDTNGYRLFVRDTLTVDSSYAIKQIGTVGGNGVNGKSAATGGTGGGGGTAGAGNAAGSLPATFPGGTGGNGGNGGMFGAPGNEGTPGDAGVGSGALYGASAGATGGIGGSGGGGSPAGGEAGDGGNPSITAWGRDLPIVSTWRYINVSGTTVVYNYNGSGGAGGGGAGGDSAGPGNDGGGGGGGGAAGTNGGHMVVFAKNIVLNGDILATGGAGGNGGNGGDNSGDGAGGGGGAGGAGGSGGLLVIGYNSKTGSGTISAAGGAGGNGGTGGTGGGLGNGEDGNNGSAGTAGTVITLT